MDGWGLGKIQSADAIQAAHTPFVDSLYQKYPHTQLITWGEDVGLPAGQMGNSEVGHLNIGAGRVVYQELQRINVAIREKIFDKNPQLLSAIYYALETGKPLHLLGLVSNGGVHSHINHLKAILKLCKEKELENVYLHAFTDGRDCDPKSGMDFLKELEEYMTKTVGKIASVSGRYYAMDRDNRWERIKLAYDVLVKGQGDFANNVLNKIHCSYSQGVTDEFIIPTVLLDENNRAIATIKNGDAVVCFNFRTDRCREITKALTQSDFPEYNMQKLDLHYTTMAEYDASFENVHVMFDTDNLNNTLGEVMEQNNLSQIRIAETEKYPHVTFFFSGGREVPFKGETRIMSASPKIATYDLQPEMSAAELTTSVLTELPKKEAAFICLNFANADMVGHTGIWSAVIKAVEMVDACVEKIVTVALQNEYSVFLTADHGNADYMINEDGTPNTAHTMNPVPFFIIDNDWQGIIKPGRLADLAPSILKFMGLSIPIEMTGDVLI